MLHMSQNLSRFFELISHPFFVVDMVYWPPLILCAKDTGNSQKAFSNHKFLGVELMLVCERPNGIKFNFNMYSSMDEQSLPK